MQKTTTNLTAHTLQLLDSRPRSLTIEQVAEGTNLKKSWLSAFIRGQIKTPSADKVQSLYEYLAKKPLLPTEQEN